MRRLVAIAAAALLPLAVVGQAQAVDKEYVQLNEKGLKQILIKKGWGPGWMGKVDTYTADVSLKGAKPIECATTDSIITGTKSSSFSAMVMDFNQGDAGNLLDVRENVYQYKDVASAQKGWQVLRRRGRRMWATRLTTTGTPCS